MKDYSDKNIFMEVQKTEKMNPEEGVPDFRDFIKQDVPAGQLLETLDNTLLHLVMLLRYEPILLESIVKLYDILFQLREFIKKQV